MSKDIKKGKHLTLADRVAIEHCLSFRWDLKEIAVKLSKDPTTVSKEIRRNRTPNGKATALPCAHKNGCDVTNLCSPMCNRPCARCRQKNCTRNCDRFEPKSCGKLKKYPYVCNGCSGRPGCFYAGFRYSAKVAEANYRDTLTVARAGIDFTASEFQSLDQLVSPLVKKGQSIYHIFTNHRDEIDRSQRTLYNYFEKDLFSAKNLDLPRKVTYKKRRQHRASGPSGQKHSFEKTYEDFISFLDRLPETSVVEMDTVEGKKGSKKVLLTLFFRNSSFMLAFLMDACTQECVKKVFDSLYLCLGHEAFISSFPAILTDNGSEFKAPLSIEFTSDDVRRTRIFYCDPMNTNQKSRLERNHEYIRYIFPKKRASFDACSQEDITLAINHINSAARASLKGNCPFQLARLLLDHALFENFNLTRIPADDVILKPSLLKK